MSGVYAKLVRDPLAIASLGVIVGMILLGIFAPWIAPHDPIATNLALKFAPWGGEFPLGSDHLGRCIASRLLFGIRTTLFLALFAMSMTLILGVILGILAGFFRKAEEPILRGCDVMLSFPSELMILAIVGMLGAGMGNLILANVIAKVAWYTRMVYSFVLVHREQNYIAFAKATGVAPLRILKTHILPSIFDDIVMLATLDAGWVIMSISALSFLGLGVQAPTPEWGMMLSEAKNVMSVYPLQMLPSGVAILVVVLAFNFLGDSIRDARDDRKISIS
ncbi:nickel/cobalt ABC transporter permease [Sulfurospirillum deleyianum]|uniref:Binding-protein-dependent transport systems inner membrane component n=1 Tax=Sulfurospirillum deleyianum (strain ATCC 51133 / DSM 6946 / 5175) TaxID=525898 RepID=D1B4M8_SULD5|nr:nickel/cobalt ABC transporter permease [Sulfurospirillum deleyianum]ACZ13048.1 binding-protein-dependent transport systems inner membrane component [Sulfurospirillum deleyianum DSM 6946]